MKKVTIEDLRIGTIFHLKDDDKAPMWIRGKYDRSIKRYVHSDLNDINHGLLTTGSRKVFTDMIKG